MAGGERAGAVFDGGCFGDLEKQHGLKPILQATINFVRYPWDSKVKLWNQFTSKQV